jgi:hypothetical protein
MTVVPEIVDIHPITIHLAEFLENNKLIKVFDYIPLCENTKIVLKTSMNVHQTSQAFFIHT